MKNRTLSSQLLAEYALHYTNNDYLGNQQFGCIRVLGQGVLASSGAPVKLYSGLPMQNRTAYTVLQTATSPSGSREFCRPLGHVLAAVP